LRSFIISIKFFRVGIVLIGSVALAGAWLLIDVVNHGVSARRAPRPAEEFVARRLRHLAIPRGARGLKNPEPSNPEILGQAMAHFADHCASCHGNNGKGQTEIGRNLYPTAPDMTRAETQNLSDGELFFIIKNGVRFTGMPAWGGDAPEDDRASWRLVYFIRHLPALTDGEIEAMEGMNPVSPAEMKEKEEADRFLEGGEATKPSSREHSKHVH